MYMYTSTLLSWSVTSLFYISTSGSSTLINFFTFYASRNFLSKFKRKPCGALLEGKEEDDLNKNHCLHVENSSYIEYGRRVVERRWTCLNTWVSLQTAACFVFFVFLFFVFCKNKNKNNCVLFKIFWILKIFQKFIVKFIENRSQNFFLQ